MLLLKRVTRCIYIFPPEDGSLRLTFRKERGTRMSWAFTHLPGGRYYRLCQGRTEGAPETSCLQMINDSKVIRSPVPGTSLPGHLELPPGHMDREGMRMVPNHLESMIPSQRPLPTAQPPPPINESLLIEFFSFCYYYQLTITLNSLPTANTHTYSTPNQGGITVQLLLA